MTIDRSPLACTLLAALSVALLSAYLGRYNPSHSLSRHRHKPSPSNPTTPCGDFPPGIPPPDTDTTAFLCVDRNGCCNFTSVQAAVNAVANFSSKRTVIWINKGMYL